MRIIFPSILLSALLGLSYVATGQQLNYTVEESAAIHDSIHHSRWDVGGSLSSYSFRYMSEFFPTAVIHKPASAYPFRYKPKKAIDSLRLDSNAVSFDEYLRARHIRSLIVVQKGTIVFERYFSMLPQDRHTIQSINKVITSTLVTRLINEKRIDKTLAIEKYIPELKGSDWEGISVKNILDMRSGMDSASIDFETGPFTNPRHKNYQLESALGLLPKADNTPASVYQFIKELKRDRAPGLKAEYSNINTFVLGWLVEKVMQKKYADLVTEMIWKPMGASSDAYMCLSEKGIPWPHGGMSVTLRDLARFGMLYTNSEILAQKQRIVSFSQLQEIFDTPPIENMFAPFKWGYQWDLASDGMMSKGGFGGQVLLIHPEKEIVIAYFNFPDKDWGINNMISDEAINKIIEAIDVR